MSAVTQMALLAGGPRFPLDKIGTSATAAWSIRKLRGAYSGSAIRIRRSSDNSEQDIGFDSTGYLDTSAITSFVGANSAFVVTWYDQSGSSRNLTNATSGKQARIVNSGSLDTAFNTRAAAKFDGTDDNYTSAVALSNYVSASAYTTFEIVRPLTGSASNRRMLYDQGGGFFTHYFNSAPNYNFGHFDGAANQATISSGVSFPENAVMATKYDGATITLYRNGGGSTGTDAAGNISTLTNPLSFGIDGTTTFDGYLCEVMTFNSTLSNASLNTLGIDIASFYGTSWTSI